jgi:hypothetical protein
MNIGPTYVDGIAERSQAEFGRDAILGPAAHDRRARASRATFATSCAWVGI